MKITNYQYCKIDVSTQGNNVHKTSNDVAMEKRFPPQPIIYDPFH